MNRVQEIVKGKSVALVGNSIDLLRHDFGHEIDGYDVVIRMNLGMPDLWPDNGKALGQRTTIWACARYWHTALENILNWPVALVWMKLTKLGSHHLHQLRRWDPPCDIICWPRELEDSCRSFVGADPTTGMRMAWFLRTLCDPGVVTVFGMDHYTLGPSHWSRQKNTPNHQPSLEKTAMERLGL